MNDVDAAPPGARDRVAEPEIGFHAGAASSADLLRPLAMTHLLPLMQRTSGQPAISIALLDGPVAMSLPALTTEHIRHSGKITSQSCTDAGAACRHGTFLASLLTTRRSATVPGICPECTLLVRPIFTDSTGGERDHTPRTTPQVLATAILESI